MISTRVAIIMAIGAFATGGFVMSPVPQAIAAVIATDVQCTGCVGTTDLAGNAVTAAKIKDGEVKAAEIAANAVGAAELQGVTKLQFPGCSTTYNDTIMDPGEQRFIGCAVSGITESDRVMVTKEHGNTCFAVTAATPQNGFVAISLINACPYSEYIGTVTFSVIVYKPG